MRKVVLFSTTVSLLFVLFVFVTNAAVTWTGPVNISNTTGSSGSGMSEVVVDGLDGVHKTWCDGGEMLHSSKPSGGSWSAPVNVSQNSGACQNSTLIVASDGSLHLAWEDQTGGFFNILYATKSAGGSWSAPVNVSRAGTHEYFPGLVESSDGALHLVWWDAGNAKYFSYATKSVGGSWSAPVEIFEGRTLGFTDLAITSDDTLHVVMHVQDHNATAANIYHYSKPNGGAWSGPTLVSDCSGTGTSFSHCFFPTLVAQGNTLHASWRRWFATPANADVHYSSNVAAGGWSTPVNVSNNSGDSWNGNGGLAVDVLGNPHLVWRDQTTGNGEILYSESVGGVWSTPTNLSNTATVSSLPSITFDSSNYAHVTYSDLVSGNNELYYVTSAPPNQVPVADAGSDQTVLINVLATLDGSGSSDPDSDPLTYLWSEDVANPQTGLLSDSTSVNPSFTPTVFGAYTFTLVVNDGTVDSSLDTVTVTVANQGPVAVAGTSLDPNGFPALNASLSTDDVGITDYSWQIAGEANPRVGQVVSLSDLPTGEYSVELTVLDGGGLSGTDTMLFGVPARDPDDTTSPVVESSIPLDGDTNVSTHSNISITFSEFMDAGSTISAFSISPAINGNTRIAARTLLFIPQGNLSPNTTYTISVAGSATDEVGNPMGSPFTASFTTGN